MFENYLYYNLFDYLCEVKQSKRLKICVFDFKKIFMIVLGVYLKKRLRLFI